VGLSCSAPNACVAVGFNATGSARANLVEMWDGTSWAIQPAPEPSTASGSGLSGITCLAIDVCATVGSANVGVVTTALAEAWDGASWVIVRATDTPGAINSGLAVVSCATANSCVAIGSHVGNAGGELLAEAWDGISWRITPMPIPAGSTGASIAGVSCPAASTCIAVGVARNATATSTLAENWNGTAWTIVPSPNPTGTTEIAVSGVSCAARNSCIAVGYYSVGGLNRLLAERWNGHSWAILHTASPPGSNFSVAFAALSCATTSFCLAVGYNFNFSTTQALAEAWDGASWTIVPTPRTQGTLFDVSCPTIVSCAALGVVGNKSVTESWDGTSWTITASPRLSATSVVLSAISCSAPTACTAVGHYISILDRHLRTLAEAWDGARWTVEPTPRIDGLFAGVSCLSSNCTAVGRYGFGGPDITLVETGP
jgi:hypothetical protein